MQISLVNPRGFCAGVRRAVGCLETLLERYGAPIYVYHEIVHNRAVLEAFQGQGVIFVESFSNIPGGSVLLFSAHGVDPKWKQIATHKKCKWFDATCPLVARIHRGVQSAEKMGAAVVLIGHSNHPEIQGTLGHYQGTCKFVINTAQEVESLPDYLAEMPLWWFTQTTLSVREVAPITASLIARFPHGKALGTTDICYATTARQRALIQALPSGDGLLVIGSAHSSNGRRLLECGLAANKPSLLVDRKEQLSKLWLDQFSHLIVTAAASTPESLVTQLLEKIKEWYPDLILKELPGVQDERRFPLPLRIRNDRISL